MFVAREHNFSHSKIRQDPFFAFQKLAAYYDK